MQQIPGLATGYTPPPIQTLPLQQTHTQQWVLIIIILETRPEKNRKGGSGKWNEVEVYTAPGMQAHFRLALDWHSIVDWHSNVDWP